MGNFPLTSSSLDLTLTVVDTVAVDASIATVALHHADRLVVSYHLLRLFLEVGPHLESSRNVLSCDLRQVIFVLTILRQ